MICTPHTGVVETGQDLALSLETGESNRIRGEGVGENLQGDVSAQLRVGGAMDLPHFTFPDEGGHVVVPQAVTDGQGHELEGVSTGPFYVGPARGSSRGTEWRSKADIRVLRGSQDEKRLRVRLTG